MKIISSVRAVPACLALLVVGCAAGSGVAPSPSSPSMVPSARPEFALDHVGQRSLVVDAEAPLADAEEIASAAGVTLSGNWEGLINEGGATVRLLFKFTHTGNRLIGVLTKSTPPMSGLALTFDLTQKSVKGAVRTFQGTLRITEKGRPCSPANMGGSVAVNTGARPMTITSTFTGKGTKCVPEPPKWFPVLRKQ